MDATFVLGIGVIIILYLYMFSSKTKNNLPGPPGYPIIGNTFEVDFRNLHLKLFEWSKIYGEIFHLTLFGKCFVVVNSSNVIRQLFCKEPNATVTSARPSTFAKKYYLFDSDVSFCSYDGEWIQRRKLLHRQLYAYGDGLQYIEEIITKKLKKLTNEIYEQEPYLCDPKILVDDFIISVLQIMIVGRNSARDSQFHRYLIDLNDSQNVFLNQGIDTVYSNLPFLRFLPLPPSRAIKRAFDLRDGLLNCLEKQTVSGYDGIYQAMKKLLNTKETPWFNDKVMNSILIDLIGGGFLTTRGALLLLIRILMSSPDVQSKLQEEVDQVVGPGGQASLSHRQHMPYAEAVVMETLRYMSHVPLGLLHASSQDLTYGEFKIPKGSVIISNIWAMHHDEKEFDDPFNFDPERFLDDCGELLPADHEIRKRFMGFSIGRRSCPGEVFAKSRMFLFLITIMQNFTLQSPSEEVPPMLHPKDLGPVSSKVVSLYVTEFWRKFSTSEFFWRKCVS